MFFVVLIPFHLITLFVIDTHEIRSCQMANAIIILHMRHQCGAAGTKNTEHVQCIGITKAGK